jgi:CheY-like chemotaxis protein
VTDAPTRAEDLRSSREPGARRAAQAAEAAEPATAEPAAAEPGAPEVAVVADDLIWATRLGSIVRAAGARPTVIGSAERLAVALAGGPAASDGAAPAHGAVIVDLAMRRSDPFAAIEAAVRAGRPVVAVGAHEDLAVRKRALAAGALRVYAYSKLFEDGPATIAAWLALSIPAVVAAVVPATGPDAGSGAGSARTRR